MALQNRSARLLPAIYIGVGCFVGFVVGYFFSVTQSVGAVRNVTLNYRYESSPRSWYGDDGLEVDSIQFHPNYVLVQSSSGDTSLFAVERLQSFSYRPQGSE